MNLNPNNNQDDERKKILEENKKDRSFSWNYTSERQAFYYELAKNEWIDINNRDAVKDFIIRKNKEIHDLISKNITTNNWETRYNYLKVVTELRQKYNMPKYFDLDFLHKLVNFESNKEAFKAKWIDYSDFLKLPKNHIVQDKEINSKWIPKIKHLINSQTEADYGFAAEWVSNAIDASVTLESRGKFGEWFLQSLDKINIPWSRILVSTKKDWFQWYDVFIKKDWWKMKFWSMESDKTESWTSVKIEKLFSELEQEKIKYYLKNKFKSNTYASININWELINDFSDSKYLANEELDMEKLPNIEINIWKNWLEVIDHGTGMDQETIAKKLLYPNAWWEWKTRKRLSDEEVRKTAPKQTKLIYKSKTNKNDKTKVSFCISGVEIESFETSSIWDIWELSLEFPWSSPISDARNYVELSREVAVSMWESLSLIEKNISTPKDKIALLEIIWSIYEELKKRSSNIVDEEFVLSSVMKDKFQSIREDLEESWIWVVPSVEGLVDMIGYRDNIFYISPEFADFDIDSIKDKKEIERVNSSKIKSSYKWEKYKFFETDFSSSAQYDYMIYKWYVFVNSRIFEWKNDKQIDEIRSILNPSINLDISHVARDWLSKYGRLLTSSEEFIENETNFHKGKQNEEYIEKADDIDPIEYTENLKEELKEEIISEIEEFKNKYKHKCHSIDDTWLNWSFLEKLDYELENSLLFKFMYDFTYIPARNEDLEKATKLKKLALSKMKINFLIWKNYRYHLHPIFTLEKYNHTLILEQIEKLVSVKSEKVTKPYLKFVSEIISLDLPEKELIQYLRTLDKVISTDVDTAIDFLDRFWEKYKSKIWYNIFKDYSILEEKLEKEENNFKVFDIYASSSDAFYNKGVTDPAFDFLEEYNIDWEKWDYVEVSEDFYAKIKKIRNNDNEDIFDAKEKETIKKIYVELKKLWLLTWADYEVSLPKLDIFNELSQTYPQDLITFVEFLKSNWEFLEAKESKIEDFEPEIELKLSDLIWIVYAENDAIKSWNDLETLKKLHDDYILKRKFDFENNRDLIAWVNIAQDEVSMYFLREWSQNSRDAAKKWNQKNPDNKIKETMNWDFSSLDNHFVSSISDQAGMDVKNVLIDLLVPYNSSKEEWDWVWQFGKWFFTFAPSSEEIKLKTSIWDWKVLYAKMIPIKINWIVSDFDISLSLKNQDFKWSIFERKDETNSVKWNLRAMKWVNLLKKYAGNMRWFDLFYNGTLLNNPDNIELISSSEDIIWENLDWKIINLWRLDLIKNTDNISRYTKDDLWISEIKENLLKDFPDWIIDFFKSSRLSLDIPSLAPIIWSRWWHKEYYTDLIKPYFYRQVIDYLLKTYVSRWVNIPMLPEDYYWLKELDFDHWYEITSLASRYNFWWKVDFSSDDFEKLKDKKAMAEFLVLCRFEYKWEITSLHDIKQDLHNQDLEKMKSYWAVFQEKLSHANDSIEWLNKELEKYDLTYEEIEKETWIDKKDIKKFLDFIDDKFKVLMDKYFWWSYRYFFYKNDPNISIAIHIRWSNNMWFNIASSVFKDYILNYDNPLVLEDLIETVTHEMAHNLEKDKWWTHESDEEHDNSFIKIQRMLLKDLARSV